jgi:hypothetical protein
MPEELMRAFQCKYIHANGPRISDYMDLDFFD